MLVALSFVMSSSIAPVVPVVLMFVLGTGQAHTFMPTQASAFDTVAPEHTGAATALYNATRQVGSAVGVAVAATIIATVGVGATEPTALPAFRWALIGCAWFSVGGSLIAALTVHDEDAAPSMGLAPAIRAAASASSTAAPAPGTSAATVAADDTGPVTGRDASRRR